MKTLQKPKNRLHDVKDIKVDDITIKEGINKAMRELKVAHSRNDRNQITQAINNLELELARL